MEKNYDPRFTDVSNLGGEQIFGQGDLFEVTPLRDPATHVTSPTAVPLAALGVTSEFMPTQPARLGTDTPQCIYDSVTNSCKSDCGQTTSTCIDQNTCGPNCKRS